MNEKNFIVRSKEINDDDSPWTFNNPNRIIRIKQCNVYLLYLGKTIYLFQHSNLDISTITNAQFKGNNTVVLSTKAIAIREFQYEIMKIAIDEINEEYMALILNNDNESILQIHNLRKIIQNPVGNRFEPVRTYVKDNQKILDVRIVNPIGNTPMFLILFENETLVLTDENFKQNYSFPLQVCMLYLLPSTGLSLVITADQEKCTIFSLTLLYVSVKQLKEFSLSHIFNDHENEYKINHLNSVKDRFLCIGAFRKRKTAKWGEIDSFEQHFYFLDITKHSFIRLFPTKFDFFHKDVLNFAQFPSFISYCYDKCNIFTIGCSQDYHTECYVIEQPKDNEGDYAIFKEIYQDDQEILLPKITELARMNLFGGINIVAFKLARAELTIELLEYIASPLAVCFRICEKMRKYEILNENDIEPLRDRNIFKNEQKQTEENIYLRSSHHQIIDNLSHRLKFYSSFLNSSYSISDIATSLESFGRQNNYQEEEKLITSLTESYIKQKDSNDLTMSTNKEQIKIHKAQLVDLFNQKLNIDKHFNKISNVGVTCSLDESISTLLSLNTVINTIGVENVSQIKEIKLQMEKSYDDCKMQLENLKEFVMNFQRFKKDFQEFQKKNEKIKMNSQSILTFPIDTRIFYESLMKKFEEVLLQLDFKYEREMKPLLIMLQCESSNTTQMVSPRTSFEKAQCQRYYECQSKLMRILSNHDPEVNYFEDESNDNLNFEGYFTKSQALTIDSSREVESKKYFENLLAKIKKNDLEKDASLKSQFSGLFTK